MSLIPITRCHMIHLQEFAIITISFSYPMKDIVALVMLIRHKKWYLKGPLTNVSLEKKEEICCELKKLLKARKLHLTKFQSFMISKIMY